MKVKINFYGSESIFCLLKDINIRTDERYMYISTSENKGEAFPIQDVKNIEIGDFLDEKSIQSFFKIKQ